MFSLSTHFLPCLILAGALSAAASQKSVVIPLVPVSKWQLVLSDKVDLQDLAKYGDQIAVDQEFGVRAGVLRKYRSGSLEVSAIFEEAADPSSAYGLYTFYQKEGMTPERDMQLVMTNAQEALMTRGRYFIRVLRPPNGVLSEREFRSLLTSIGGARLSVSNLESLPSSLSGRDFVPGTEKYLLGLQAATRVLPASFPAHLIGFQDGVEAQLGEYQHGQNRLTLLELSYPTPQMAQMRFKALGDALELNKDRGPGSVYGRQQGSYAFFVLNSKSVAAANQLLDQFKVSEIISWSAPYPGKGSMAYQLVRLVLANIELVVIIIILAIAGGAGIFLTKKLILKLFPNSSWVRSDKDEVIKLNLS